MKTKTNKASLYVPFAKSDDEKRMVYGYCTSEALDSQGEVITSKAIQKAWEGYMEYANVREMHQPSAVGVTKEFTHDADGTFIGVHVVDDRAWGFVKEGVYKGFSIGGRVLKKSKNVIEEILLYEISLVDRPANPDAKFASYKMDDALVDAIALEANNNNDMNKFVEIDGVKYKEDPENAGQPLKGEDGNPVALTAEELAALETPVETEEERVAREATETADANIAAGLNADGSAKEVVTPPAADAVVDPEAGKAAKSLFEKTVALKDTFGTITMASVLDHLDFVRSMFEMNGKDTGMITKLMDECKALIASEAGEADKAALAGDLAKALGTELSKAMAPLLEKVDGLASQVADVVKDVNTIKGVKVSPRPVGSAPVEKVIESGASHGSRDAVAKRAELDACITEISKFADEMRSVVESDPSRQQEFMNKSAELHKKYEGIKKELNEILAVTGGN